MDIRYLRCHLLAIHTLQGHFRRAGRHRRRKTMAHGLPLWHGPGYDRRTLVFSLPGQKCAPEQSPILSRSRVLTPWIFLTAIEASPDDGLWSVSLGFTVRIRRSRIERVSIRLRV